MGFPVQEHNADEFYRMETHYDNPTKRTGVLDNSGLRITLTKQFRQHDAGLFELGVIVKPLQVVPPGEAGFISSGYCADTCVNEVSLCYILSLRDVYESVHGQRYRTDLFEQSITRSAWASTKYK